MKTAEVQKLYSDYVLGTYTQLPICLVRGKGSYVWDIEEKKYLDFFPGWAVSGIGHCHPIVSHAIKAQARKILHISNNYLNLKQAQLAREIVCHSFPGKVFFANSGAEAIEGVIKFARKYGSAKGKTEIITMEKSFHGRTLAALTATGQPAYHKGFDPLPQGFRYVPFNDIAAFKKAVGPKTAAVIIEPIQGEGGINVADTEYLQEVRANCSEQDILLIFDEVQTGMGRTGKMFAYQHSGVVPDLMTLAKSLGGGAPIGAFVVHNNFENVLTPGSHASTFGGNPLVTAAGLAVFKAIEKEALLKNAVAMGAYLKEKLEELKKKYGVFEEIKGVGLMVGVQCSMPCAPIVQKALERGLLINCTQGAVLRIMPAMTVTRSLIDNGMSILGGVLAECM